MVRDWHDTSYGKRLGVIETTILGLLTPELLQQVQGPYVYILSTDDDVMYILGRLMTFNVGFGIFTMQRSIASRWRMKKMYLVGRSNS